MGGDDLGYDDDYLLNPGVTDPVVDEEESSSVDRTDDEAQQQSKSGGSGSKKRKSDAVQDDVPRSSTKKSSWRVMLESGRNLTHESAEVQSDFLWTALTHHTQMRGESIDGMLRLKPIHFCASSEPSLEKRIRDAVSMKKLKKWKVFRSPMVLVVCLSARRAVAVLKEVASCKVRAAKLFAKHLEIESQRDMLEQQTFPIAVGTPHRLLALCQDDGSREASLRFDDTKLVILDSHANQKGYTVCTLPDTAPATMDLLRETILPQLSRRKDIQIAMF